MSDSIAYGKLTKRIVFTDSDHRHAQFILKLKNDNLNQSDFFRTILTGYINDDERIREYVEQHGTISKKRNLKRKQMRDAGLQASIDLGLSEEDVDDLFDIIAREHPEL